MNEGMGHALEQALAYYRAPALLSVASQRPLPEDVLDLIRLAAGDAAQIAFSAAASGEPPERVQEAAVFFVQQVLFAPGADNERVLGVNPGAPLARTREHYRWLVRWLHPDRNTDDWHSVYTDRVVRAWQSVKRSGAAGGAQDDSGEWPAVAVPAALDDAAPLARAGASLNTAGRTAPSEPLLSARAARRLPAFVLGGLALVALSAVGLLWVQQNAPAPRHALATPPAELAPSADELAVLPMPAPSSADPAPPDATPAIPPPAPTELVGNVIASTPATDAPLPASESASVEVVSSRGASADRSSALGYSDPAAAPPPAPSPAVSAAPSAVSSTPPVQATSPVDAASVPTSSAPATAPTPAGAPTEAEARVLLQGFSAAYAAGDINALMRLFTRDATNNRGGRDAIAYDYQTLFNQSRRRELQLQPSGWIARGQGAVVLARYEARVTAGLLRTSTTRGDIRFTLATEDGLLKISQVIHD